MSGERGRGRERESWREGVMEKGRKGERERGGDWERGRCGEMERVRIIIANQRKLYLH